MMRHQLSEVVGDTLSRGSSPPKPRFALRTGIAGRSSNKLSSSALASVQQQLSKVFSAIERAGSTILNEKPDVYTREPPEFRLVSGFAAGAERLAVSISPTNWLIEGVLPFAKDTTPENLSNPGLGENSNEQNGFVEHLKKATNVTQFPSPAPEKRDQVRLDAASYLLRQIDLLIAVWDGTPPNVGEAGAIAKQAFEGGIPVVWISTTGDHVPRLIADFDEKGSAVAPETDCTQGPLTVALRPIVGGPRPEVGRSGISPLNALQNFYSEAWRPHCYCIVYDFLARVATLRWPRAVVKARSFSDQCSDWDGFFDAAPEAGILKERLSSVLRPRFVWADSLAVYYSHLYRSAYISAYLLSALAVFAGLAGVFNGLGRGEPHTNLSESGLLPRGEALAAAVEFVLLALAIIAIWRGRRGLWLERWLNYRTLAESLRHTRFLAFLSEFGAVGEISSKGGGRNLPWTLWYLRATMRELGLPSAILDSIYQWKTVSATLTFEIDEQIRYHEETRRTVSQIDWLLRKIGTYCIYVTLIILSIFLVGWICELIWGDVTMSTGQPKTVLGHIPYYLQRWLVFFTAGLPAFGAALAAIRGQGEFESSEQRSARMIDSLNALRNEYETAMHRESNPDATAKRLIIASRVMSEDLAAWEELYGRKRLELPA
jgi:hypothetical protein